VRFEQLYPLRPEEIRDALAPYADGTDLVWVQEEPWNSGAWYFMNARLPAILGDRFAAPLRGPRREREPRDGLGGRTRSSRAADRGGVRAASLGVRQGDRHVLVPPLFGSMPHELEVTTQPELPFAGTGGQPGFIVGRMGRESIDERVIELDTTRMLMCDRYADEVADVALRDDEDALDGPFQGRHLLVSVDHGRARVGDVR
jgi:hypothetical protein